MFNYNLFTEREFKQDLEVERSGKKQLEVENEVLREQAAELMKQIEALQKSAVKNSE